MASIRHAVPETAAGERLDRFVATVPGVGSRAAAERLLAAGDVLVDGVVRPKSHRLEGGEEVVVDLGAAPAVAPAPAPELRIAYEDEHLLVVDKPAGLVVHPAAGHASGTLVQALAGRSAGGDPERPGIVHRLDRDTSGLLVVARTQQAYEGLRATRAAPRARARVPGARAGAAALPHGAHRGTDRARPARPHTPLARHRQRRRTPSRTSSWSRLLDEHALLRVRLETGRTHQIRVHLAAIGLPVVGDPVYGTPEPGLRRQFLHAARLAFTHPVTGEQVDVVSPLPADLDGTRCERVRG